MYIGIVTPVHPEMLLLLQEVYAVVSDGDEAAAVEVADGLLIGFLGDAEAGGDVLSR